MIQLYAVYETNQLSMKGWKKIFHTNSNQKKVGCLY